LLSGLAHPNLPHIHQHFADAEHWYLVMDFINGETLEDYLGHVTGGHLPLEEVLSIGIQLCSVLWYLHAQQPPIIFRDVKPANVMRTASGKVYLIDFGIARRFRPGQRRDTAVLGSPGYAPPEQYGTAQTSERSDIYSLGATLHCLLTGNDPEEATSGGSLPAGRDQEAVAALQRLLGQMLAQDADRRPPSMQAVRKALRRIQVLQSLAKRGISRRKAIVGLASLVGLATVGGGLTLSALIHGLQDPHLLYTYYGSSDAVNTVAWSPDGRRIASAGDTVQVWDAFTGGNVLTYQGHLNSGLVVGINIVAWSPDGRRIASGSDDKTVQVWDAFTGGHMLTYRCHSYPVNAVAWSPNGRFIASASDDNTVQVWDATTGEHVLTYQNPSGYAVNAVAWSFDGRRIASGSWDNTVQVWDAFTGGNVLTYRGHSDRVEAVAWSPDGRRIASGSDDKTVQVWSAV
jgi:protein kinase-like protein/WD40 domain-containing protein